jgi:hypothetical protein
MAGMMVDVEAGVDTGMGTSVEFQTTASRMAAMSALILEESEMRKEISRR